MTPRLSKFDLPDALREISHMARVDCCEAWTKAFSNDPPKYLSVSFMQRVLTHDLQCRKLGGHSAATKRALKAKLARGGGSEISQTVTDGATLVREWNSRLSR